MPFVSNPMYNDAALGQGFSNLAQMFAPPSGSDLAGYAQARANDANARAADAKTTADQAKASREAEYWQHAADPSSDKQVLDQEGAALGLYHPTDGWVLGARGQDMDLQAKRDTAMLAPVAQGAVRYVPSALADLYKTGPLQAGNIVAQPNETILTPAGQMVKGAYMPSQDQMNAQLEEGLINSGVISPSEKKALAFGNTPITSVRGANGTAVNAYRPDAIGQEPAYPPNKETVTQNDGYGQPVPGTVWSRNQDGSIRLDSRGAPIAIPYQGGPAYAAAQKADQGRAAQSVQSDLVLDTIGQVLGQIRANPNMTTGIGAQLTGGIGGSPAKNVASLLDTVKANIGFDKLQAMRAASPTGGALGQVSDVEEKLLQSTYSSVEQAQSAPQLVQSLERLEQVYYDTINGPGAYAAKLAAEAAAKTAGTQAAPVTGAVARPQTDQDFSALPSGAVFVDPDDGKTYRKP